MKVFIDTNIILEFLMRRERVDVVETLLESLKQKGETMYMTVGSFYSLLYHRQLSSKRTGIEEA